MATAGAAVIALVTAMVTRRSDSAGRVHVDLRAVASASLEPVHIHLVGRQGDGVAVVADGVIDPRNQDLDITETQTAHGHRVHSAMKLVDGTSYSDPHDFVKADQEFGNGPTDAQLDAFLRGRQWLRITALKLPPRPTPTTMPEEGDIDNAVSTQVLSQLGGDVTAVLQQLLKSGIHAIDLGGDTIDGTPVEHLRLRYSPHDLFPHSTDDEPTTPVTTLDIWVDAANHERRAEVSTPAAHSDGSSSPSNHITTDFTDYGSGVKVTPPDPSDVVSYDDLEKWLARFRTTLPGLKIPPPPTG